jgi:hypothetical protein
LKGRPLGRPARRVDHRPVTWPKRPSGSSISIPSRATKGGVRSRAGIAGGEDLAARHRAADRVSEREGPDHARVSARLDSFGGQLAITGAVIAEAMHFVSAAREGAGLLSNFVAASSVAIYDYAQPPELRAAADLMARYHDVPMDYTDATLVLLGGRLDLVEDGGRRARGVGDVVAALVYQQAVLGSRPTPT